MHHFVLLFGASGPDVQDDYDPIDWRPQRQISGQSTVTKNHKHWAWPGLVDGKT